MTFSQVNDTFEHAIDYLKHVIGMLHMEVVQERLERESGVEIIQTAPNVTYQILTTDGEERTIERPSELPEPNFIVITSYSIHYTKLYEKTDNPIPFFFKKKCR